MSAESNPRVTGIGGVFFRCKDPAATAAWYQKHLGIDAESWNGAVFRWSEGDPAGTTTWGNFDADSSYFPFMQQAMINFRVANLDATLEALRDEGVRVVDEIQDEPYGKFGWIFDIDGRRVELWQPAEGQ